ncbi:hypothetical protein PLESTM_001243900 [Pleodorina starrii]|nr:hypothetical protein PLESTM_001243900 [Pleodorina starrii]
MAALGLVALPAQLGPAAQQCDVGSSDSDADECWICLSGAGVLTRPCACPRVCHRECIATWQLTNYGRREENFCRFCNKRLPALWKPDAAIEAEAEELRVAPVMAVRYNGPEGTREFKLRVRPGPEGLAMFKAHLKEILGFDVGPEFDVTFECQMPSTGSMLTLSGLNAYGAATHCAALLAATKVTAGPQAGPTAPAAAASPVADQAAAPQLALQQQQQQQHHRQQRAVPTVLLPSEVPSASAAAAPQTAAVAAAAPHCSRRICQTGYLLTHPQPPIAALQQQRSLGDMVGAGRRTTRRGSALSYLASGGPAASRHLGPVSLRHATRASSDMAPEDFSRRELAGYDLDDLDDDLLPYSRRHGALAAVPRETTTLGYESPAAAFAVGGGAGAAAVGGGSRSSSPTAHHVAAVDPLGLLDSDSDSEEEEDGDPEVARVSNRSGEGRPATAPGQAWMAGAVRFGGRVLPVSPSGSSASPTPSQFTASSGAAAAVRPSTAVLGGLRGGCADQDGRRALTSPPSPPRQPSEASCSGAAGGTPMSESLGVNNASACPRNGAHSPASVAASVAAALGGDSRKRSCAEERSELQLPQRGGGGGDDAAVVAASAEGGASGSAGAASMSRGGARLTSAMRRVARRTLNSLARAIKNVKR